jgi:hypothetical protein
VNIIWVSSVPRDRRTSPRARARCGSAREATNRALALLEARRAFGIIEVA